MFMTSVHSAPLGASSTSCLSIVNRETGVSPRPTPMAPRLVSFYASAVHPPSRMSPQSNVEHFIKDHQHRCCCKIEVRGVKDCRGFLPRGRECVYRLLLLVPRKSSCPLHINLYLGTLDHLLNGGAGAVGIPNMTPP